MPEHTDTNNTMEEEIKKIRLCILAFKAEMQVQTTDNSEGQIFDAVPVTMINQFFDILERKSSQAVAQAKREVAEDLMEHFDTLRKIYLGFTVSGEKTWENGINDFSNVVYRELCKLIETGEINKAKYLPKEPEK